MASATSTLATLPRPTKAAPPATRPSRRRLALAATLLVVLGLLAFALTHLKTRHGSFAVAVAPFYGADAESEKEGRVMTALVESELLRRLPEDDVDLVGVERVARSVRSPRAARLLLQKLDVNVLVWGEALAFQGDVEVATRLTRRDGTLLESGDLKGKLSAGAANPIELRRARAAAIADAVAQIYRGR
jgi:hypothetical protein